MAITSGLKLNVNRIKSPFGSSAAIPKISAGGGLSGLKPQAGIKPSSILSDPGTLVGQVKGDIANIDRTIAVEKRVSANEKKITILKKILQNQKESGNKVLQDTNEILKDIGNALALDFASRIQDNKDRLAAQRRSLAAQRRRDKEEGIEGKDKIDKDKSFLSKSFDKVTQPIQNIFGKIFEFFSLLGAGILAKGAFDWLQNPENLDKAKEMFKWLGDNWKWIAGAVALGAVAVAVAGLVTTIAGIWGLLSAIGGVLAAISPVAWPVLAIAALGLGAWFGFNWVKDRWTGGPEFTEAHESLEKSFSESGIGVTPDATGTLLDSDGVPRQARQIFDKELNAYRIVGKGEVGGFLMNLSVFTRTKDGGYVATQEQRDAHKQFEDRQQRIRDIKALMDAKIKSEKNRIRNERDAKWKALQASDPNFWGDEGGVPNIFIRRQKIAEWEKETKRQIKEAKKSAVIEHVNMLRNEGYISGMVNGQSGDDKIAANLTKGEFVINKDQVQKIGSNTLNSINSGDTYASLQRGVQLQSENNKSQKRINDEFRNVLVGFNTQLANVAASSNTGGAMKPTPRSRPNISAVPKQIGGVLVKPRRNRFLDMPLQQAEIDARTVKENTDLQRQEELLVKSRAGRLGSDIEISPYDPSNEYWVAQAYESYGFPGWSDLL